MNKYSIAFLSLGVYGGIVFALILVAFTYGCTKSVEASTQPPNGWQCDEVSGTCTRIAAATLADEFDDESGEDEEMPAVTAEQIHALAGARVIQLPAIEITGCVTVNEPGRVVFCESEVGPIVGPDALALE